MDGREASRSGQIAAELRRRIETGELAPGDRVPSTREITRRWNVAMATATKVLTQLRHEGLVRAVPGVGTVVSPGHGETTPPRDVTRTGAPPSRRNVADRTLTLTRIVTTAIAIADAEGLAAVSMRRVAGELGVATMSLYRHVTDKDDLVARMMDASFSEWPFPADPPEGWRERLELAGRMLWAMFRRHPWLAPALSVTRPQPVPSAIPFTEWVLTTLDGRGLDLSTTFTSYITLFNYIRGTAVNIEMEMEAEALTGQNNEEWMDTQEPT
ncbi:MAG TPA: GntR family transcriptional regulator, partial [Actinoallomurus sp.]|nr:GntR family transcriptional regulator [Actinoallomurus sp.]